MKTHVLMLANNDWKYDSRVVREAESLASHGYAVSVICRRLTEERVEECQNGVVYHIFPLNMKQYVVRHIFLLFRMHVEIMLLDASQIFYGPTKLAGARALGRLAVLLLMLVLAVPLLPVIAAGLLFQKAKGRFRLIPAGLIPQNIRRIVGWFRRQLCSLKEWLSSFVRFILQPLTYLNGFAFCCLQEVIALRPDIIHAHDLVTLSCGTFAARRVGCSLVYDAHELETHTNYWGLNPWTKYWIARYEAQLAPRAEAVITVCESIADWLAKEYRMKRPHVILNVPKNLTGRRRTCFDSNGAGVRDRLGLGLGVPLVIYVGSVTIDRGLEECVEALAYLPAVHFAAIGPRYIPIEERMKETAARIGVGNRLYFVDPVPPTKVVDFIASADCSLMAIQNVCLSYYFCFPNKLLESVIAGLPVAVGNLLEMRRFVEKNGVGLVVDETDPVSIADGVRKILAEPLRFRPNTEKINDILTCYGWAVQQRRLVGLYEELG